MSFLARRRQASTVARLQRRSEDADKTVARLEDQMSRLNDEEERLSVRATAREQWLVDNAPSVRRRFALERELWWREHQSALAAEVAMPSYLSKAVGERPDSPTERAAWRQAVKAVEAYRTRWGIRDEDDALGRSVSKGVQQRERTEIERRLARRSEPGLAQEREDRSIERSREI